MFLFFARKKMMSNVDDPNLSQLGQGRPLQERKRSSKLYQQHRSIHNLFHSAPTLSDLIHFEFQAGSNILLMRLSEGILYETNLPKDQLFHHLYMVQVDQQWN